MLFLSGSYKYDDDAKLSEYEAPFSAPNIIRVLLFDNQWYSCAFLSNYLYMKRVYQPLTLSKKYVIVEEVC